MWTIYYHITPNGKYYVGITSLLPEERWGKNGRNYRKQLFGKAIKKYGWDNIQHYIFDVCEEQWWAELTEEFLINTLDTTNPEKGYNVLSASRGEGKSFKHSEETKLKMSMNRKGRKSWMESASKEDYDSFIEKQRLSHLNKYDGEKNPACKLTKDDVVYIKEHYKFRDKEYSSVALGKKFGVSSATILSIKDGRLWKNLEV